MKAVMFRPIPMKAWGPSLGAAGATLSQGDAGLINSIDDLESTMLLFDPEVHTEAMARSRDCRNLVNSIPPVPDDGWTDAWIKASDCVRDLRTYVEAQTLNIESAPIDPREAFDDSERIMGLDPMVFWGGSVVAGVLLIAGVTGAFK